jgi:hypothetical protein
MTASTTRQQELTISETIRYYSAGDEECFFAWLKSVPGFVSVIGKGRQLRVQLAMPIEAEAVAELTALFKRYGLDTGGLKALVASKNLDEGPA